MSLVHELQGTLQVEPLLQADWTEKFTCKHGTGFVRFNLCDAILSTCARLSDSDCKTSSLNQEVLHACHGN